MTSYPNREHQVADEAARRRALANLESITASAGIVRQKLEKGYDTDGSDARLLAVAAGQLAENLQILETLRDVREWWRADQAAEPEPDMSPEARAQVKVALDAADPVRGKGRDLRG